MFPNPQDALPLPPHPSLEQYRKLAKDLVKACRSGDPDAIGSWADRWIESLAQATGRGDRPRARQEADRAAARLESFVLGRLKEKAPGHTRSESRKRGTAHRGAALRTALPGIEPGLS